MNHYKIIDTECDEQGAYDFDPNGNCRVGHLVRFSINNKDLEADTLVYIPDHPATQVNIVGPIGYIRWDGAEVLDINGRISPINKGIMQEALTSSTHRINVEAEWVIYGYDFHERKYFQRMHTNKELLKFEIAKDTYVYLSEDLDRSIKKPMNFTFQISLSAMENIKQEICWACSATGTQLRRQISS